MPKEQKEEQVVIFIRTTPTIKKRFEKLCEYYDLKTNQLAGRIINEAFKEAQDEVSEVRND